MSSPFRPVSFWQSALMTLPDAAFFDLLRSALGTVKTPFNKQSLVEELSRFIVRPEIQENIAAYIDSGDWRIIAAIALLSEPGPGELESFFSGEYSYAELQNMLINLEERLIIYRFRDSGILRIALNPRLENILAPHAANTGILFSAVDTGLPGNEAAKTSALNDRNLAAFFAFLLNNEVLIKDDANGKSLAFVFRKKAAEQSKLLFPGLDIDAFAGGFFALGLFNREEEELVPDFAKIAAFKTLPKHDRIMNLAGSIALFLHCGAASFQSRSLIKNIMHILNRFGAEIKRNTVLPEATMIKLAELFKRKEESAWGFLGELPSTQVLLRSLVLGGIFSDAVIEGTKYYCPLNQDKVKPATGEKIPHIAMDSGFSLILYPEIGFADALDLAFCCTVEETGTAVRFALSRDSVIRGFDRGYSAQFLWQLLERLSLGRIPGALKWNLDDWEKRWNEVSLNQGVVLSLGGERSYLAQTGPLASMVKRVLAPGVFLLSVNMDKAADALRSAGVDIVGRPKTNSPVESKTELLAASMFDLVKEESTSFFSPLSKNFDIGAISKTNAEQLKEKFRLALEKMKLAKQEKEKLEFRIERRMVVSENQLKDTSLRHERLEARSLDYVGKTGIVKQAIATGSLLELSCLNGEKILGFPESLDKKDGETILSIVPREGGEPVKLALGKISLIKRIKQSIFGV